MSEIKQYILSIVCMGTLCGIIQLSFSGKNSTSSAVRLITGLVLTVTVLSPLMHIDVLDLESILHLASIETQGIVAEGEQAAEDQMATLIKQRTESYIMEKAKDFGLGICADVELENTMPPVPRRVTVIGPVTPYAKKQLSLCMREDLEIAEENQIWIS